MMFHVPRVSATGGRLQRSRNAHHLPPRELHVVAHYEDEKQQEAEWPQRRHERPRRERQKECKCVFCCGTVGLC